MASEHSNGFPKVRLSSRELLLRAGWGGAPQHSCLDLLVEAHLCTCLDTYQSGAGV